MRTTSLVTLLLLQGLLLAGQNNPLEVESYTLSNGLTVYLNEDHNMPMVHGMVVVKGGAKRDPADATGIAHYFEHIMFKGTDQLGTISYPEEKVYLDSIKNLYDRLGTATGDEERAGIQNEINRISLKAAEYAVPNEFSKIIDEMGGTGTNASTSKEYINYYNSCPSNQVEKWLELYSHRFINPVFRLFQSELETVYEEKNMDLDDPITMLFQKYQEEFFRKSPYGQQTILGTLEHLKNPSLSKMEAYFDTYYVANNMALILSGDFDTETVKPLIREKFGRWRSGPAIEDLTVREDPFDGLERASERITPVKVGIIGYRSIPRNHEDELKFEVVSNLLSNYASTGLLDELVNDNQIMMVIPMHLQYTELGGFNIFFIPKILGQSLASAEDLVMAQLSRLKAGDFSDTLLAGVKTELRIDYETNLEDMRWRTYSIMDAFLYGISWEELLTRPDKINGIKKEDVVALVNEYFSDDRLVFYSKMGFPKKAKLEKPPYEAVEGSSSEKRSDYAERISNIPVLQMDPRFIDFDKDVHIEEIAPGITSFVSENPINDVFSISLKFGKGHHNDPLVDQAAGIVMYANPDSMEYLEFRQKLQMLGGDIYAYSDLNYTTLEISGLEENLGGILDLTDALVTRFSVEEIQLEKLVQDIQFEKKYEKKDLMTKSDALGQFALYSEYSDYLSRLDEKEVKKLTSADLEEKFKEITQYDFEVHYCGRMAPEPFNLLFLDHMTVPEQLTKKEGYREKERLPYAKNTIFVLDDKKAIQSFINIYVEGGVDNEQHRTALEGFNQYMDGSMSSILFQEIREFRSLAYTVGGTYKPAYLLNKPGYFEGFLTTQSDKTTDALQTFQEVISDLPRKPERMESIRNSLTLSINANQPPFRHKSDRVSRWMGQGYTEDPRKSRFNDYQNMPFTEIEEFFSSNLKDKPWLVTIVGDTKRMDMGQLSRYGTVKTIKIKQLFN